MNSNQNSNNVDEENIRYISFPYIKGLSEYIKKILFFHNIHATFKPTNSLSLLFSKLKDKDPLLKKTFTRLDNMAFINFWVKFTFAENFGLV